MRRGKTTTGITAFMSAQDPAVQKLSQEFNALGLPLDLKDAGQVTLEWRKVSDMKSSTQSFKIVTNEGNHQQLIEIHHNAALDILNMNVILPDIQRHFDYAYNLNEGGKLHFATFHLVPRKGQELSVTNYQCGRMIAVGGHSDQNASLINIIEQGHKILANDPNARKLAP